MHIQRILCSVLKVVQEQVLCPVWDRGALTVRVLAYMVARGVGLCTGVHGCGRALGCRWEMRPNYRIDKLQVIFGLTSFIFILDSNVTEKL